MNEKKIESGVRRGVTVGTFDGVHRGHQLVVETLASESARRGLRPLVVTFEPHPLCVVAPDRAPGLLSSTEARVASLSEMGAEVSLVGFTPEIRRMTAREWMQSLSECYGAELLMVGYDNKFGSDGRTMTFDDYRRLGAEYGIEVLEAPVEAGVSSSAVRRAVTEGRMELAADLLGRRYRIEGRVGHGRQMGRQLGFPTANLQTESELLLPATGVYAALAFVGHERYDAVVSVGYAPTVTDGMKLSIEAHLIGFEGDIYDRELALEFVSKIRDEKKFGGLEELKAEISKDVEKSVRITQNL